MLQIGGLEIDEEQASYSMNLDQPWILANQVQKSEGRRINL